MSYQMKIDPKSRKAARFISRLQSRIQTALSESGMTQQQVATKIGVDRSVVNRRLLGKANLTARSIAEFAYAFDMDVDIDFKSKREPYLSNWVVPASSAPPAIGSSSTGVSTTGGIPTLPNSRPRIERVTQ
jgi:plasmid maintenance system antidote protein VapI